MRAVQVERTGGPEVLTLVDQQVVEADEGGMRAEHAGARFLAVEALLDIGKRADVAAADHQQLAVEHGVEAHRLDDLGEGRADVVGPA